MNHKNEVATPADKAAERAAEQRMLQVFEGMRRGVNFKDAYESACGVGSYARLKSILAGADL